MVELIFAGLAWYACGVAGFLYWWTEDHSFSTAVLPDAFGMGVLGPIAVLAGYLIHRAAADAIQDGAAPAYPDLEPFGRMDYKRTVKKEADAVKGDDTTRAPALVSSRRRSAVRRGGSR